MASHTGMSPELEEIMRRRRRIAGTGGARTPPNPSRKTAAAAAASVVSGREARDNEAAGDQASGTAAADMEAGADHAVATAAAARLPPTPTYGGGRSTSGGGRSTSGGAGAGAGAGTAFHGRARNSAARHRSRSRSYSPAPYSPNVRSSRGSSRGSSQCSGRGGYEENDGGPDENFRGPSGNNAMPAAASSPRAPSPRAPSPNAPEEEAVGRARRLSSSSSSGNDLSSRGGRAGSASRQGRGGSREGRELNVQVGTPDGGNGGGTWTGTYTPSPGSTPREGSDNDDGTTTPSSSFQTALESPPSGIRNDDDGRLGTGTTRSAAGGGHRGYNIRSASPTSYFRSASPTSFRSSSPRSANADANAVAARESRRAPSPVTSAGTGMSTANNTGNAGNTGTGSRMRNSVRESLMQRRRQHMGLVGNNNTNNSSNGAAAAAAAAAQRSPSPRVDAYRSPSPRVGSARAHSPRVGSAGGGGPAVGGAAGPSLAGMMAASSAASAETAATSPPSSYHPQPPHFPTSTRSATAASEATTRSTGTNSSSPPISLPPSGFVSPASTERSGASSRGGLQREYNDYVNPEVEDIDDKDDYHIDKEGREEGERGGEIDDEEEEEEEHEMRPSISIEDIIQPPEELELNAADSGGDYYHNGDEDDEDEAQPRPSPPPQPHNESLGSSVDLEREESGLSRRNSAGRDALEQAVLGYESSHHDDEDEDEDDISSGDDDLPMDERMDSPPRTSPKSRKSPTKTPEGAPQSQQKSRATPQSGSASGWAWNTSNAPVDNMGSSDNFESWNGSANFDSSIVNHEDGSAAKPPTAGGEGTATAKGAGAAPDWFSPAGSTAGFFASNDFFGESKHLEEEDKKEGEGDDDDEDDAIGLERPPAPPIAQEIIDSNPDIEAMRTAKPIVDLRPRMLRFNGLPTAGEDASPPPPPAPVVNALTGNLISLRQGPGTCQIEEFDPTTKNCRTVSSAPILTVEMRRRIHSQYGKSPVGIAALPAIAAGVHRQQGRARVRVAAIVDFVCVEAIKLGTNKPTAEASSELLRVVAVWSWGYATFSARPVALQSVIVPPSSNADRYDATSLCVADGLLFLASVESPPTVFIAKPNVRDGWSGHRVTDPKTAPSSVSISALAVTSNPGRSSKYLAVGLTDGNACVWSYDLAATTNKIAASSDGGGSSKAIAAAGPRLLVPVCRLVGSSCLDKIEKATLFVGKKFGSIDEDDKQRPKRPFACTNLAWLPPGPAASTPLMLAAAFPNGVAIYHVSIPLVMDLKQLPTDSVSELSTASLDDAPSARGAAGKGGRGTPTTKKISSTTTSTLSQASLIAPFAAARSDLPHRGPRGKATVSWLDLGPRCPPTVALLFQRPLSDGESNIEPSLVIGAVDLVPYGRSNVDEGKDDASPRPIAVICERIASIDSSPVRSTTDMVCVNSIGSVICHSLGGVFAYSPYLKRPGFKSRDATKASDAIEDKFFTSLAHPVCSQALGLNSGGFISSGNDDVFHVFSVLQRRRESLRDLPSSSGGRLSDKLGLTEPVIRHWLCRSIVGDRKESKKDGGKKVSVDGGFQRGGGDVIVTGGAETAIVCELTCAEDNFTSLIPSRIVRASDDPNCCAVLFSPSFTSSARISKPDLGGRGMEVSSHPIAFAIIDASEPKDSFELSRGQDIVFFPATGPGSNRKVGRAIVLDEDEMTVHELLRADEGFSWTKGDSSSLNFADSSDIHAMVPRRVFIQSSSGLPRLLFAASRAVDGRTCLLLCKRHRGEAHANVLLSDLVQRDENTPTFWLERREHLLSLVELPRHQDDSRQCIAIATQYRVLILSSSLRPIAEYHTQMPASSLAPLGSHCVAFCSSSSSSGGGNAKIRYLSCIRDEERSRGIIATIPSTRFGYAPYLLLAIRPDRLVYLSCHKGMRLVEHGEDENMFLCPIPATRPAFLLEPLVANALCQDGGGKADVSDNDTIQLLLRTLLERFGRKTTSFPHAEGEGTGTLGTGITQKIYELLDMYCCRQAAAFLLTGNAIDDSTSKGKILPPWLPSSVKVKAAGSSDNALRVLSSGDEYLSEYVSSPENAMASNLPPSSGASAVLSMELAAQALRDGNTADAMKLLDFSGSGKAEEMLLQIALARQNDPNAKVGKMLKTLYGGKAMKPGSKEHRGQVAAAAALASNAKGGLADAKWWSKQLATSIQNGRDEMRIRNQLIAHSTISSAATNKDPARAAEHPWDYRLDDSKNVWCKGPFNRREEILLLDKFEDWLGRKRPAVLGKEGAEIAAESGEKTLADILAAASRDPDEEKTVVEADEDDALAEGWVHGVGEGRNDEDNLSLYLRFSEGGDEDSNWKGDGIEDLSKYEQRAFVCGSDILGLEATTSSADEGEAGKVKLLYDLVFNEAVGYDDACGLYVEAKRGSSLDVGMFHTSEHDSRQRCTVEFWCQLPKQSAVSDEIVLARRSLASEDDDLSKLCSASERDTLLWELVALPSGRLQFRASGGGTLDSEPMNEPTASGLPSINESEKDDGLVSWQREDGLGGWNHACLTFSCKGQQNINDCHVSLIMKGINIASKVLSIIPPGLSAEEACDVDVIKDVLACSALMFGLAAPAGFRITEVRAWSCERDEDDVKLMMTEYLRAAETKKKFTVKIRSKKESPKKKSSGFLAPPKSSDPVEGKKTLLSPLAAPGQSSSADAAEVEPTQERETTINTFDAFGAFDDTTTADMQGDGASKDVAAAFSDSVFGSEFQATADDGFPTDPVASNAPTSAAVDELGANMGDLNIDSNEESAVEEPIPRVPSTESIQSFVIDAAPSLSQQVRNSAAAALIRGPPATRHFGGNRGGLMREYHDHSIRTGVGSIAICGAEKTVIYSYDESPPGKTYPIGASGAIISDIMDSDGSEYLCCFLAREKRMVVFELVSKTVVVELQMTTKLNYWRFLPPEVHGNTLVYMLITPVGGFHWMPLDESPRPRQAWKRGSDLQGKKIVSYEEGGCNGGSGRAMRSTLALMLASTATSGAPVEAWCLPVNGDSKGLLLNDDILGAALFVPPEVGAEPTEFFPYVVTASKVDGSYDIFLEVASIGIDPTSGLLSKLDTIAEAVVVNDCPDQALEPAMAMGSVPAVYCCCHGQNIVVAVRNKGIVVVYNLREGVLKLLGQKIIGQYVVDAGVRSGESEGDTEIVLLLCDKTTTKDGHIARINVSKDSGVR